jgi:hypothetical protein
MLMGYARESASDRQDTWIQVVASSEAGVETQDRRGNGAALPRVWGYHQPDTGRDAPSGNNRGSSARTFANVTTPRRPTAQKGRRRLFSSARFRSRPYLKIEKTADQRGIVSEGKRF